MYQRQKVEPFNQTKQTSESQSRSINEQNKLSTKQGYTSFKGNPPSVRQIFSSMSPPSNTVYKSCGNLKPSLQFSKDSFNTQQQGPTKMQINLNPQIEHQIEKEETKCSTKNNGAVHGYAANTNKGLIRNYNEDRVAIILNIMKPLNRSKENWPKCSFFGVYDGHGGVACADFLRDNLHQFVIKQPTFPSNPKEALRQGFLYAEEKFLEQAEKSVELDRSGSCAIVALMVGDQCFVANVGDSRAVMSGSQGQKVYTLSRDHKPNDEDEKQRILEVGGRIYQSKTQNKCNQQVAYGPFRVFPGRLSVSRTFGDIECKLIKYGGNPQVVICDPEIRQFQILQDHDFLVLGSDGIFDKLSSKDAISYSWDSIDKLQLVKMNQLDIHQVCGNIVEGVMDEALQRKSCDNVTVLVVGLQGLSKAINENEDKENKIQFKLQESFQKKISLKQPSSPGPQEFNHNKASFSKLNQNNKF